MISVEELKFAISQSVSHHSDKFSRDIVKMPLLQALDHVLAVDVLANFDIPRQNVSAMDGFAIVGDNQATVSIVGESVAGRPYVGQISAGQGVRIFTGAVVPSECTAVIMQEDTNWNAIGHQVDKSKPYYIEVTTVIEMGMNIRKQGEEVVSGECVLSKGRRLTPADISLLASLGVASVAIYRPLTVGIIATGDELIPVGQPLVGYASIYNSNTPTLQALLKHLPIVIKDYGIVVDDMDVTCQVLQRATAECDVVISTAGVSVGDYDYLTHAVDKLGQVMHYKVAMKPGKPFVFGKLNNDSIPKALYFGLPGNPLSCLVGCLQFIIPALWQLSGVDNIPRRLRLPAKMTHAIIKKGKRKEFARGVYYQGDDGVFYVTPLTLQDSHRIKQLSYADCLLILEQECQGLDAGDEVMIEPFRWGYL